MRLGLLADVHEAVELLDQAIERLDRLGVDRFVFLGDLFETGPRLDEAARRLREIDAIGVWGNHDFGLCSHPTEEIRSRYAPTSLEYMGSLRPSLQIDGSYFSHIEPWLDATSIFDLWHMECDLDFEDEVAASLPGISHARSFMGHKHRWLVAGTQGRLPWNPQEPLALPPNRPLLIVVHAVVDGWCAHFDTVSEVLVPVRLDAATRGTPSPWM